ncbi:glutamyl-tRNA(Gln) amidotransferase subunit D [Candidatus Pacearchaeota archaeon RBG_19FT_COMBO_34_9]|nr:MAG: glutamyl-tRNA(Gln) amidotransferase subunit D [Candidatus Pacearchaeota archaeon RBG_19FT_COMBO_34_9]OGJ16563.1 MAG: glutamyl-tRNA(Gln) amidotransferase subunit D [Candidatus Pacearchaeota archaeon RBG_13_33_26]
MEKTNAIAGDYVEIHLTKLIYEGTLLESPENEKGIVLLKLDSGYNVGFSKKDILEIIVLKKSKEKEISSVEIKKDNAKPNIAMVITGGTIASILDPKTGGVHPLQKPEDFFEFYPELFEKVNVARVEIPFMKASEDMDFKDWQKIAKIAVELLNDDNIRGIIITHGTDFLHYTSAALSFFIRNLNKPVVLTYSQRSIDRASSDANLNLQCSALAAISDIAEVIIVGHATPNDNFCYAMPGTKVRKMHASRRDAFKAVNTKPFAKIFPDRIERISEWKLRNKNKAKPDFKFEEKVALVKVYPGQNPDILDYYVKQKYKGLILELSGLGHAPTKRARNSWTKKLKEIQNKGIIVCAVSQCIYGRVDPLVYSNGREILETGVIYLEDMLAETALVKMGWVLGHEEWRKSKKIIKEKMLENISGELNNRLEE